MNRRAFLKVSSTAPAVVAASHLLGLGSWARAQQKDFAPRPGTWRTFELTTRVEVLQPAGVARVWVPAPSVTSDYQQTIEDNWAGNAKVMRLATDPKYGAIMLYAEFAEGEAAPMVELTSRFKTQDRAVDWSKKVPPGLLGKVSVHMGTAWQAIVRAAETYCREVRDGSFPATEHSFR